MTLRMTPKRAQALNLLNHFGDGVYAGYIATKVVPTRSWWPQAATRWGCGFMQPMVDAGWVTKNTHVECGGAKFYITNEGSLALKRYEFAQQHAADIEAAALAGQP